MWWSGCKAISFRQQCTVPDRSIDTVHIEIDGLREAEGDSIAPPEASSAPPSERRPPPAAGPEGLAEAAPVAAAEAVAEAATGEDWGGGRLQDAGREQEQAESRDEGAAEVSGQDGRSVMEQLKGAALEWFGQLAEIALEYPVDELSAAAGAFDDAHRLGAGAAGAVFRGTLRGGTEVAIKVLADQGGLEGFEDEVRVLSRFRHPNLVTLLGWGQEGAKKYLVYELLHGGDLQCWLARSKKGKQAFGWRQRLRVAWDAASGLAHMATSQPKAFHRDIKPANILIGAGGAAKMADFGLAGVIHDTEGREHLTVERISGTPGYTCPVYAQTARVTEQSEVYSLGIVLLELLVNELPALCGREGDMIFPLLQVVKPYAPGAHARIMAALDPNAGWPHPLVDDFADLALACVDHQPDRRPAFKVIARTLARLSHQGAQPEQAGSQVAAAPPAPPAQPLPAPPPRSQPQVAAVAPCGDAAAGARGAAAAAAAARGPQWPHHAVAPPAPPIRQSSALYAARGAAGLPPRLAVAAAGVPN